MTEPWSEPWTPERDELERELDFDYEHATPDEIDRHLALRWYLRDGTQATSMRDLEGKLSNKAYKVVKQERLWHGAWLSTVWLGLDRRYGDGPPLIFETMLFAPGTMHELDIDRYATEAEALAGHAAMRKQWLWRPWAPWRETLSTLTRDAKELVKYAYAELDTVWHKDLHAAVTALGIETKWEKMSREWQPFMLRNNLWVRGWQFLLSLFQRRQKDA